jgi:hypothetical protein
VQLLALGSADVKRHLTFAGAASLSLGEYAPSATGALKWYFETSDPSGLSAPNVAKVGRMLRALDAMARPEQLNLPGFYWHALRGVDR